MNRKVHRKGVFLDNQYVVPYNRDLLVRFQCHINLEICNSSRSLKYLFKYCLKGHDTATMLLTKRNKGQSSVSKKNNPQRVDEIQSYLDGRYVCASEAAWRILGFDIHHREPSVERLPVHLENHQMVNFSVRDNLNSVVERAGNRRTKLQAWFKANIDHPNARQLTYQEFPKFWVWDDRNTIWKERTQRFSVIGRLSQVHSQSGDLFYLRMILTRCRGAKSFAELRTVNGTVYGTFKEACAALGLLQNNNEWHEALTENAHTAFPKQLRQLFVHILSNCQVSDPLKLWKDHWERMSEDILYDRRKLTNNPELRLSEHQIWNLTLSGM